MPFFSVNRMNKIAGMCICFAICCFLAYGWRLGTDRVVHSDELSLVFVGLDMLQGNVLLKDWHFSTGIFGLTTLELGIITLIFGYSDSTIYIISGINYVLMIAATVFVIGSYARKRELKKSYLYAIITGFLLAVPRSVTLLNAGTHVLSYAAAILSLYLTYSLSQNACKLWKKMVWTFVLGMLAVTNSMFLYTTCIPIALTGVIISYENRKDKKISPVLGYGIFSIILYAFLTKLWVICRGDSLGGINTVFTSRENIWNNVIIGICNILEVYGIDVWGKNVISIHTCQAIVGFFIFAKLGYEINKCIRDKNKENKTLIYLFLGMAIVNIGAYVVSTLPLYSPDVNLIQPFLLGFSMAGILAWIHNIGSGKSGQERGFVLGLSIILFLFMFPAFTLEQPDNTDRQQVAEYLTENGYERGFAGFWNAASVMYEAGGKLTISPLICHNIVEITDDTKLVAYKWMNKKEWEQQEGNFLIVNPQLDAQAGITGERILETFGQWSHAMQFGDITLFVWDENKKLMDYGEN
ncbi:MAG: hypothetical protein ACI4E5_12165 [Suilimivivens sp.]